MMHSMTSDVRWAENHSAALLVSVGNMTCAAGDAFKAYSTYVCKLFCLLIGGVPSATRYAEPGALHKLP